MSDLTKELHEELDAFDPRWKERYPSIARAAEAANVTELYGRWLATSDGQKYAGAIKELPDRVGDARREADAMNAPGSLPFGYSNLGWLPNIAWNREG